MEVRAQGCLCLLTHTYVLNIIAVTEHVHGLHVGRTEHFLAVL